MIKKLDHFFENVLKWVLVVAVFSMLGLTLLNIFLRYFNMAFHWIDPLVRHLVFLSAFMGGALATGSNHHIKIDLLSNVLEKKDKFLKKILELVTLLVTAITCIILMNASYKFASSEFEFGSLSFLGIHSGFLVSIIPIGIFLILIRTVFKGYLILKRVD